MPNDILHVFKSGKLTVVGFDGRFLSDPSRAAECHQALFDVIRTHSCEILVVDLMDVGVVSSWILGVLATLQQSGIEVHLYHPSEEIRGILNVTRLNELLRVRGTAGQES